MKKKKKQRKGEKVAERVNVGQETGASEKKIKKKNNKQSEFFCIVSGDIFSLTEKVCPLNSKVVW